MTKKNLHKPPHKQVNPKFKNLKSLFIYDLLSQGKESAYRQLPIFLLVFFFALSLKVAVMATKWWSMAFY